MTALDGGVHGVFFFFRTLDVIIDPANTFRPSIEKLLRLTQHVANSYMVRGTATLRTPVEDGSGLFFCFFFFAG